METQWITTREEGMEPVTEKRVLRQVTDAPGAAHYTLESLVNDRAFERSWFADFRLRWQRDLAFEHLIYCIRMNNIQLPTAVPVIASAVAVDSRRLSEANANPTGAGRL